MHSTVRELPVWIKPRVGMRVLAVLLTATALGAGPALGLTIRHTYRFDPSKLQLEKNTLQVQDADRTLRTWHQGHPEIPYDVVTLLVPRGSKLIELRVFPSATREFAGGIELELSSPVANHDGDWLDPKPLPLQKQHAVGAPDPGYPALLAEPSGGGDLHGYELLSFRVYPVRYDTRGGRISVNETLDLEIELTTGSPAPAVERRYSSAREARAQKTLRRLVDNPEALATYDRDPGQHVQKAPGGFQPTSAPSLEGSPVDYIILTVDSLASSYQTLADWKTRRGVPTVVRTIEWIEDNYRHGSDLQETMRIFIQDAYAKWAVQYVLLGGDTDILPARYAYSAFGEASQRSIPSDMYFACLKGNWNRDGDADWGEANADMDSIDLYAEVFVGRTSMSNVSEVDAFVAKVLEYEGTNLTTYQDEILFLAEVLFPVDWDEGQNVSLDGAAFAEDIASYAPACATIKRLYENYYDYPGSMELTLQNAIAEMDVGYGFVNHVGHGYRYSMACGDISFGNHNAAALQNGNRQFILYMVNCTATAFDYPCLAEAFLKSTGGAVAVVGASRAAYAIPSRNYNIEFFKALHVDGYTHIGETFVQSRLLYTPNAANDTADRYTHFLYNFLGDPEMVIHTCELGVTQASFPSTIGLGLNQVTVDVTVDESPHEGALVCLQKGTEAYEFGYTDVNGSVTLQFVAETAGSVDLTVSGANIATLQNTINVTVGAEAYVRVENLTIDDDTVGVSNGNADGVLDAGETIELSGTFGNTGTVATSSVAGVLRIPGGQASIQDSTYSLGTINPGGSSTATNQLRFSVGSSIPDGTVLPLTFVSSDGGAPWTDVVNKVVHAPNIEVTQLIVLDPMPGGNNDGVIQAGETFQIWPFIKNYGTGAVDGLQATLTSIDPDVTILSASVSIGRIEPLQEISGSSPFDVTEATVDENVLLLTLSDSYARTEIHSLTLRAPAPPATPVLDASAGPKLILANWTPSTEPDLCGYHVYRSLSDTGPWTRATTDRTGVAYYADAGLLPSTRYYYYVTAMDSSGNQSGPSAIASISTNPPQLTGWPILMESSTSCTPAVGDITGDASKEIIAGNEHLYAWGWNGIELLDDDGDPQTWGVFSVEVEGMSGGVALGELDPTSPGFEVFATTWDDMNRVFVVRGDGSFASGWPQAPDPSSSPSGYWAIPSIADVDGDGVDEIFAPGKNGNFYAWYADGSPLGASPAFKTGLGTYSRSSASLANLDSNPDREIVYGSINGDLYIWHHDGSDFANFPQTPGTLCLSSTAIGDIDRNGVLDVVMITEGGKVNIYNTQTGNQLPGWPQSLSIASNPISPSPALADFDFDGYLEIVVANNGSPASTLSGIRIFDYQGNVLPGWPKILGGNSESSPIVADVSGDGVPDVLLGNQSGLLHGWDAQGQEIEGFPLSVGDYIRSVPYADDVDGDGDIDLILAGWNRNLYVWDLTAPYVPEAAQWPTHQHDAQRTGFYDHRVTVPTDAGPHDPELTRVPNAVFLDQNTPNPFNPTTSIPYGVPEQAGAAASSVRIDVFDVQGRLVRRLVHGVQSPGTYRALWDGRSDRGHRVQSGLYFYRLQIGSHALTRKMLLLK